MAKIEVKKLSGDDYRVTVTEGGGTSTHQVRVSDRDRAEYGGDSEPETLLEESFRFLLEREPKEAILSRFDLPVIGRYFPEYRREIRRRLAR